MRWLVAHDAALAGLIVMAGACESEVAVVCPARQTGEQSRGCQPNRVVADGVLFPGVVVGTSDIALTDRGSHVPNRFDTACRQIGNIISMLTIWISVLIESSRPVSVLTLQMGA